jgi:opine dehydrogenase
MRVAILGAGSTALANAWFLARAGHEVRIWSAFEAERGALASADGLSAEGIVDGTVRVIVAPSAETCLEGASLVIVAAPAFAHQPLMAAAAQYLTARQDVMVHPVTGLSSLLLSRMLKDRSVKPTIIDVSTSLFTARKTGAASVRILKVKNIVDVAAIPGERAESAVERLESFFGKRFRREANALAVSLNNHNPVYHVAPMLCNLSRAEKSENWIIWECITPGVARLVKLIDVERLAVVRHFGTAQVTVDDYFREAHGATGHDLNEIFRSVAERLKGPVGPQEFNHRFITEDVPYALVFYRSLGQVAGIEMPMTDNLIKLTSALYARDFTSEGHTVERLGLGGMSSSDILAITTTGF